MRIKKIINGEIVLMHHRILTTTFKGNICQRARRIDILSFEVTVLNSRND